MRFGLKEKKKMICTETTVIICFRAGRIFSFFCIKIYIPQWWPFEDSYLKRFAAVLLWSTTFSGFPHWVKGMKISTINSPTRYQQISLLCIKIWVNINFSVHLSPLEVSWVYACTSLMIIKSTVFGNVFRRDTALPWSIFTKLYPFACERRQDLFLINMEKNPNKLWSQKSFVVFCTDSRIPG